jgi:hypothetical protein
MALEIQVLTWEKHKNVVGLNWDPNPPLLITGSPKTKPKLVTSCMINSLDVEDKKIDDEFY